MLIPKIYYFAILSLTVLTYGILKIGGSRGGGQLSGVVIPDSPVKKKIFFGFCPKLNSHTNFQENLRPSGVKSHFFE